MRAISANWPVFTALYVGLAAALFFTGISLQKGWLSYVPLMLAVMLVLGYFLLAGLWAAHQLYDPDGVRPYDILFDMGPVRPDDEVLVVELGTRVAPLRLRRRLTTGRLMVVDVYNPQWTTSQALVRLRKQAPHPPSDPRLVWQDGRFDLFPLPDNSVPFVLLDQTLSEFWQEGDRLRLLQEIYRVLTANGRLLFAERMRTQTNWLVLGPAAVRLAGHDYWQTLLREAGFVIRREQELQGLITCIRAEKPSAAEARQLTFDLPL